MSSSGEQSKQPGKKESWWRRFVPKCRPNTNGAKRGSVFDNTTPQDGEIFSVTCASCGESQPAIESLSAFVCRKCHRVNRIVILDPTNPLSGRRCSVAEEENPVMLVRTSSSTFTPADVLEGKTRSEMEPIIPQCTVCMDGAGDVVLLPCSHSAICEACAKHIAKNKSVGGSHCPRCREDIKELLRLSELYPEGDAKGEPIVIPIEEIRKGPPKVPPPPGQNKAKKAAAQSDTM
jgi:hypothetical protein